QVMEDIIRDMAKRNRTIIFSTHVMQHAERLCDRVILMAKGKKIFDGSIPEAKRVIPRRVRIESEDDIAPVRELTDVLSMRALEKANGEVHQNGSHQWELELRENADPQSILQLCFDRKIRLRRFNQFEPNMHVVFVRLL